MNINHEPESIQAKTLVEVVALYVIVIVMMLGGDTVQY